MSNQGTTYTSEVYECSKQSAAVQIDNTEWINVFSEGIELHKGDQVRLLGSFIHEGTDSNEIEVETDQEINISYSTYLKGATMDTIDKTENGNLMDLGQIGDLPYSTDSFGIEPPMRNTTQRGDSDYNWNNCNSQDGQTADLIYPTDTGHVPTLGSPGPPHGSVAAFDKKADSNPAASGETGGEAYGNWKYNPFFINGVAEPMGETAWRGGYSTLVADRSDMYGDTSKTWGTNLQTGNYKGSAGDVQTSKADYENFSESSIKTEMYIGNMIKKFILPVIDFFETGNTDNDPTGEVCSVDADWEANCITHTLEAVLDEPGLPGEAGMLCGAPRPGMCIATVDIAQSSGWIDVEGDAFFENTWGNSVVNADFDGFHETTGGGNPYTYAGGSGYTGIPNLKSGVQSVIGTIIAVRNVKHHILGKTTDCYEIYVSNFVNPAELIGDTIIQHTFPDTHLTLAKSFKITGITGAYKQVHGGGMLKNGYNFNPSYNNINGADNRMTFSPLVANSHTGYKAGDLSGTPTRNNYLLNASSLGPNKVRSVNEGGASTLSNQEEMGLGQPQGLSFLWNGTHTGYMRISDEISNVDRYRANSFMGGYRNVGNPNALRIKHLIQDVILEAADSATHFPFLRTAVHKQQASIPACVGAYIICTKETMLNIAKGRYNSTPANNFYATAGRTPRIWIDYGFQTKMSHYTTRHYVGNSWDTTDALTQPDSTTAPDNWQYRFPGTTVEVKEKRYGYNFFGRPLNLNWRQSWNNDGSGVAGATQTLTNPNQFTAPANSNIIWDTDAQSANGGPRGQIFPTYLSSPTGTFAGLDNIKGLRNLPQVWGGYNTCINSIYFQQKDCGDANLGIGTWRARTTTVDIESLGGTNTIRVSTDLVDIDTGDVRLALDVAGDTLATYQIKVLLDNCQFNPVELIGDLTFNAPANAYDIVLYDDELRPGVAHNTPRWLSNIAIGTSVIIFYGNSGGVGAGIDAMPWNSDLIMIKENIMKLKLKSGHYTEDQLAETINDQLHFNTEIYKEKYGVKDVDGNIQVPTNVGKREQALGSQPSIMTGNFLQTNLPDINYGFTPITRTNAADLQQEAQTKDLTTELYTYEPERDNLGVFVFHFPEDLTTARPYNGTTVRKISDNSAEFPTLLGKHLRIYSIPYAQPSFKKELCLIRLKGGALNKSDFDTTNGRWDNVVSRAVGSTEMLRTLDIVYWDLTYTPDAVNLQDNPYWQSTGSVYSYRTRLTRNLFSSGGSSRIFCGANNLTLSWQNDANRYSFNNLYTPVRPHQVENKEGTTQIDFGIGDAVPSAVISAKHTGEIVGQLTGIYFNDLNAGAFIPEDWGQELIGDHFLYDTNTSTEQETSGQSLMDILGFTAIQIAKDINDFTDTNTDIFTYKSRLFQNGSAIRIGPKITPAINASNPTASKCLNIAPVQQFFVQVDTDDYFAQDTPEKGNDPYYFIGSDWPGKHFHGNENGGKLPVIGICSRNFSAFNFVFDLGGSAISYVVENDMTISSIRTKIYNSNMRTPTNLSSSSSVIYMVTRYNYTKNIEDPLTQQNALNLILSDKTAPVLNQFYSEPTSSIRMPPAINPPLNSNYYTGFGQMVPIPEAEEEYDSLDE